MMCSVAGCEKPAKHGKKGHCYGHYMKQWRYGTPEPVHPSNAADVTGQRIGALVMLDRAEDGLWRAQCDCGAITRTRIGDLNRGSVMSCGDPRHRRADAALYGAAHQRVRRDRGSASAHPCVDCGGAARQWSYNRQAADERQAPDGRPYSLDPADYDARCIPCHKRFDLDAIVARRAVGQCPR